MKKYYCVIGTPIEHSLSPIIHNELYKIYGLVNCKYIKANVDFEDLQGFISKIQEKNIFGFNVTMPLKKDIISYLATSQNNQSINTVTVNDGVLSGYSTDTMGFLKGLENAQGSIKGKNITILGAGAVAAMFVSEFCHANKITLVNRTYKNAHALVCRQNIFPTTDINTNIDDCDLIINTTPLGMLGDFESFTFLDKLKKSAIVYDLIYSPPQTNLIKQAQKRGLSTQNGLDMLIWQGFFAFEKFFGIMPTNKDYFYIKDILSKCD